MEVGRDIGWTDKLNSVSVGVLLEVLGSIAILAPGAYEVAIHERQVRREMSVQG